MMRIKYGNKIDNRIRTAVRGVLIKDNQIGIMKVDKFDCYIFPGGGVDEGEDLELALNRELLEETGYKVRIVEKLLETESGEYEFTHVNHYYFCEILDEEDPSLTDLEVELGIHFMWIDKDELYEFFLNYHDDNRFGEENRIIQRSIRSRGHLIMSRLNMMFDWGLESLWLGKEVTMKVDRPVGFKIKEEYNPYPINYGYIDNIYSLDGAEVDCYYLDSNEPLSTASGKVVAVVKRLDDVEDKLVISNLNPSKEEVKEAINFIEQYFNSIIVM